MTTANPGDSSINLPEPLQRFADKHYAEQQRELDNSPFNIVSTHSIREDHVAILTRAHQKLTEYANGDTLLVVATLVLLNDIGPTRHDDIVAIFGDKIAALVAETTTPFDRESGNALLWEDSLYQMSGASTDAQRVRLALLWGQVMHSPGATGHLPSWHQEAMALSHGDPALQQQVIAAIEADWAAA